MAKSQNESKTNVVLTALLVVFVCLLSFGVGVISGKGWSDREYKVRHIEQDTHLKMALSKQAEETPIGEDMTEKEVELLTERALNEARTQRPEIDKRSLNAVKGDERIAIPDSNLDDEEVSQTEAEAQALASPDREKVIGQKKIRKAKRKMASVRQPTMPAPTQVEYTVQVAAYKTMGEAENHAQKLIDKGFPAFPVKAMIDGQEWYRVSIGSFKSRHQAVNYERNLKKQAVVKNTFVQKIRRR